MEEIRKEPVTVALILINVLIFIAVELTGTSQDAWHVLNYGAAYTPYIVEKGEVYRLFTSMFLHFGIEHLVNNMLVLFVLGSRLEQVIGKIRFVLIYLLGGIAGNILSLVLDVSVCFPASFFSRILFLITSSTLADERESLVSKRP